MMGLIKNCLNLFFACIIKNYPLKEYFPNGKLHCRMSTKNHKDYFVEFWYLNGNRLSIWKAKNKKTHGVHQDFNYNDSRTTLKTFNMDINHGSQIRFIYE